MSSDTTTTSNLQVYPLHDRPEFLTQCCELLNDEWRRSETARLRSLEVSRDGLPTCLVLVEDGRRAVGHLKLTPIPSTAVGCYVESVVIDRQLRGRGLGKHLMEWAEWYCKEALGLRMVFLSTKGQEGFYRKLGYVECGPVSIYGSFGGAKELVLPPPVSNSANKKTYMYKDI